MAFSLQLSAGVELHGHAALQVFLCDNPDTTFIECEPYFAGSGANAALLVPELGNEDWVGPRKPLPQWSFELAPGADDAILADDNATWNDHYEKALMAALVDKIGGICATGNPPRDLSCGKCNAPMEFLAQFSNHNKVRQPFIDGALVLLICPQGHEAACEAVR